MIWVQNHELICILSKDNLLYCMSNFCKWNMYQMQWMGKSLDYHYLLWPCSTARKAEKAEVEGASEAARGVMLCQRKERTWEKWKLRKKLHPLIVKEMKIMSTSNTECLRDSHKSNPRASTKWLPGTSSPTTAHHPVFFGKYKKPSRMVFYVETSYKLVFNIHIWTHNSLLLQPWVLYKHWLTSSSHSPLTV